jgi:hypothetical protein
MVRCGGVSHALRDDAARLSAAYWAIPKRRLLLCLGLPNAEAIREATAALIGPSNRVHDPNTPRAEIRSTPHYGREILLARCR